MSAEIKPKFHDGSVYQCRVEPGAHLFKSRSAGTLGIKGGLLVKGGEMGGEILPMEIYLTEKTKDSVSRQMEILGFNTKTDDWRKLGEIIAGKSCVAIAQDGQGKYAGNFKSGDIRSVTDYIPGGMEQEAAMLFQNVGTTKPDPDAYNDRY